MAVDSRGSKGEPIFLGTSAPATAADLTRLGTEIYERGTRPIGTTAERSTLTSNGYAFKGLAFYDTTLDRELLYDGTSWTGYEFIDWTDLLLATGWTATRGAQYMLDRDRVYLRGDAGRTNNIAVAWTRFASVPPELAPPSGAPTFSVDAGSGATARVQVYDATLTGPGNIYVSQGVGVVSNRCSLDGIHWSRA